MSIFFSVSLLEETPETLIDTKTIVAQRLLLMTINVTLNETLNVTLHEQDRLDFL